MPELTPIELDTLKFQLENGLPLDRNLVTALLYPFYEQPIVTVPENKG